MLEKRKEWIFILREVYLIHLDMTCIYLINIVMISQKILCNGIREMFVLQSQVSKRIVPLSCMEKVETLVKVSFLIKINCVETDA